MLIDSKEAAAILKIALNTFKGRRRLLIGFPLPIRRGRALLYDKDSVIAWAKTHDATRLTYIPPKDEGWESSNSLDMGLASLFLKTPLPMFEDDYETTM